MIIVYEQLSKSLILYHASENEISEFDISKSKELGLHAGTLKSALDRSNGFNGKFHIYKIIINESAKFIELEDSVTSWISLNMVRFLINKYPDIANEKTYIDYRNKMQNMNEYERSKYISNLIINAGYNCIKYINEIEDPGSISYAILNGNIIDSIEEINYLE